MTDHAKENARGWLQSIREALATYDASEDNKQDEALELIQEMPLSVVVRDGWRSPGDVTPEDGPDEYEILLTTGGPALRVYGHLGRYCEPSDARLQWQDWGTPWTDCAVDADEADLLTRFAALFWLGD